VDRYAARLFGLTLVVAIPPLGMFAIVVVEWPAEAARLGMGTLLALLTGSTLLWAGVVTVIGSRLSAFDTRRALELAERGSRAATTGQADPRDDLPSRLLAALEERNRQISVLAQRTRRAPIHADAAAVAHAMTDAARIGTGDPTWSIVIMQAEGQVAPGVYGATSDEFQPLEAVHMWASTLEIQPDAVSGVRHATGPWGGFVTVDVAGSDEHHAFLMAPWQGRPLPTRAEQELLALVGQQAGMAIEHALIYARVRDQTRELDRMATLQGDFLRAVSHDLQSPLTSIRALAEEARTAQGLDMTTRTDLDAITHQAERLSRMVGQLLTMSRLEAGALTPASEVFRIEPIVERTWHALRADRPFSLHTQGRDYLAVGDPDRLEQALWAVLDNAVKYSPPDSPINVSVSPAPGDLVGVAITDAGRGMSAETQLRAFDQFYRSPDASAAAPNGSGVGLYAARGLVRAMGGDIVLDSRLGSGTTLTILLPAEAAGGAD
jgi:two-component system sensor histidine kinase KdpD